MNLNVKMAWNLAAPHTWPAAIMPCLLAIIVCSIDKGFFDPLTSIFLLIICVLMQSAVNTLNDYFDYVKGVDSAEDNLDPEDNVLPYYKVKPHQAIFLAIGFLAVGLLIGSYLIHISGILPLIIGLFGTLIVFLYSGGKTPISYLPIGELVSGIVMGCLIPLGVSSVLCPDSMIKCAILSVPCIISVGMIMQTNNTCDIEKDIDAHRRTFPIVVGRATSVKLYRLLSIITTVLIIVNVFIFYTKGLIIAPFYILAVYPLLRALFKNPLLPASRIAAMGSICSLNITWGAFYCMSLLASSYLVVIA